MNDALDIQVQEKCSELIQKYAEKETEKWLEELQPEIEKLGLLPVHCDFEIDLFSIQEKNLSKGFGFHITISKQREILHKDGSDND